MRHPVPTVLAAILPLLVLSLGAWGVARFEPRPEKGEARELANAGRVMNGRRLNTSVVDAMEAELAKHEPEVLIVGNSYANTNIDPKLVAKALDLPPRKVRVLSVPNSVGSHWYAMLKNRVYANGHHPPLVIVVSPLQSMLLTEPYSEASYTNLTVQLEPTEPLLDTKIARSSELVSLLRQKRGAVRDTLLAGVRDAAVGLIYPSERLRRDNEQALERVFHDSKIDMERYRSALPVVETREGGETGAAAVPHPTESMLPHLAELATANGSRLLFVRSPMAPRTPPGELDAVPEGWEQATFEVLDDAGHFLADLSGLPMQDALFHNPGHMSDEGARLFTRALTQVIRDRDVYGGPPAAMSWRPGPPTVEGGSEPPAGQAELVALLDGRWLAPGDTLTVGFDEGWEAPAVTWDLQVLAEQFGEGALPRIAVDGAVQELDVRPAGADRRRLRVDRTKPPPQGPWSVTVSVDPGAPPVLVQGIRVGRGVGARQVLGRPENHLPVQYELFGQLELRDGRIAIESTPASYLTPPPQVPRANRRVTPNRRRRVLGALDAADLDFLSDANTMRVTPLGVRCSPIQVLADGVPLPRPHEACSDKTRGPLGRVCHGPNKRIVFSTLDGEPVARSPVQWSLALDPERSCAGGRWLYPGDQLTVPLGGRVLDRFREGARTLTLTGAVLDKKPATVTVYLRVDQQVVLRDVLLLDGKDPSTQTYTLNTAIWPDDGQAELILENLDERFVLITGGVLAAGKRVR